jgi:hypothetical protein
VGGCEAERCDEEGPTGAAVIEVLFGMIMAIRGRGRNSGPFPLPAAYFVAAA